MRTARIHLRDKLHSDFMRAKKILGLSWDEYFEASGILGVMMSNCTDDIFSRILVILKEGSIRPSEAQLGQLRK